MSKFSNLIELLEDRSRNDVDKGYYFINKKVEDVDFLSYEDLCKKAKKIASILQSKVKKGDRVVLLFPQSLDYISAFFGCLLAGVIAVPAYPPRNNRNAKRLESIINNSKSKLAFTNKTIVENTRILINQSLSIEDIEIIATDDFENMNVDWEKPVIEASDIAFLQYTSGSTKAPRGVMVTHENLLHNSTLLQKAFEYTDQSHCVSWLPMYHDMGLIGGILQPLFGRYSCTIMSPTSFLQRPFRWLKAISEKKATISGSPNFGYDLCVNKITKEEALMIDLSSWKVAFNGAETINSETMRSFATKFAVSGFESKSFFPCYGLAEATLFVSGGPIGDGFSTIKIKDNSFGNNKIIKAEEIDNSEDNVKKIVASGKIYGDDLDIRIMNEDGIAVAENTVGEIYISGNSITKGYWKNSVETKRVFRTVKTDNKSVKVVATGDLGFIQNEKLYVTGRIKDLIIIRGVNHYPQDIENTVINSDEKLNPQSCAAFSIHKDDFEELAIVLEVRHPRNIDLKALINKIRRNITKMHGIELNSILITKSSKIPKTTSGKIQRYKCKKHFLNKDLPIIKFWRYDSSEDNVNEYESRNNNLVKFIKILKKQKIGISPSKQDIKDLQLFRLSELDSLKITELTHILERDFDISLSFAEVSKSENLAELLEFIKTKPIVENILSDNIEKIKVDEDYCQTGLSFGQKGFWLRHQLYEQYSPDNLFVATQIKQAIDVDKLKKAVILVLEKYKILRTVYKREDEQIQSYVNSPTDDYFNLISASEYSVNKLKNLLSNLVYQPFDLEKQLSIFNLYCLGKKDFVLLIKIHHSLADYWSLKIIVKDLLGFYDSLLTGKEISFGETDNTYDDYIIWQNNFVNTERGKSSLEFWKHRLESHLPILSLPFGKEKLGKNQYKGEKFSFEISKTLLTKIKHYSSKTNASQYTTLLASFFILLYRYTNQSEQIVGSPFSGRTSAKWAETVGYFVNPLPIRLAVSRDDNFQTLQKKLKNELLAVSNQQDYPFNLLVDKIKPSRVANKNPVFQTMFVYQNEHNIGGDSLSSFSIGEGGGLINSNGLELRGFELDSKSSQFDLSVFLAENKDVLSGKIEFNTAIFDKVSIEKFVATWQILLQNIISQPKKKIDQIAVVSETDPIIDNDQQSNNLYQSSDVELLQHLFEAQVIKTPNNIAVEYGEKRLTYQELDKEAENLATLLNHKGIGSEDLVGLCLSRTEKLLISIFAVLKAGAAYVPLDLNYPDERLSYISRNSGIKAVIQEGTVQLDWLADSIEKISIDNKKIEFAGLTKNKTNLCNNNQKLAYVIYTSGSTGKPKGVSIEHRNAVSFIKWCLSQFSEEDLKYTLASTSINFDLSIFEMIAPLCAGGRVLLVENALHLDELINKNKITTLNTVPSVIAQLIRVGSVPNGLANINLAGEPLNPAIVKTLYNKYSAQAVFNLYGPSEDTTYSTFDLTDPKDNKVTIGKPISETQVYLLNSSLQKMPDSAIGEIYISGAGLARGYLNKADLTAKNFLPDPFSDNKGSRMYRTGDLAQRLSNGKINYVGRIDNQVKIRGFRIELGEIESNLRQHPKISDAVVITKEFESNHLNLISFYTTNENFEKLSNIELRSFLKMTLPEYMIPQHFAKLDSFPLTPNNKINRLALKEYEIDLNDLSRTGTLPVDLFQKEIAEIWKEVLNKDSIYLEDNFFELGGTSLQIIQVLSRIKEKQNIHISIKSIYDAFTVKEQANLIKNLKSDTKMNQHSKIKRVSRIKRKAFTSNN